MTPETLKALEGSRSGTWTIVGFQFLDGNPRLRVHCTCGSKKWVRYRTYARITCTCTKKKARLRPINTEQCKALAREAIRQRRRTDVEYYLCELVKKQADVKKGRLAFDLTPEDIVIPKVCPLLGVPLERPILIRRDRTKGWLKTNVLVVSLDCKTHPVPKHLRVVSDEALRTVASHLGYAIDRATLVVAPISVLDFREKTLRCAKAAGLRSLGDLLTTTHKELSVFVGKNKATKVSSALRDLGLQLWSKTAI